MNVPLLDLDAHHRPLRRRLLEAVEALIDSNHFILGPEVTALEERIASYCQTQFAIGVSSGSDALLLALMALGIRPGDEVVTSPYSFFATVGAIVRLGATPVFVDIDPVTYNIDPAKIESAISSRTRVLLPVHLYGQCADMEPILQTAEKYRLQVVEDAAQAIGAEYRGGRRAGGMSDIGCFSFYPSKNLGALGDAGMVVTSDSEIAEKLRILRVHGAKPKYHHHVVGGNFRIDAIQAAVLNVKLDYLDEWTRKRQENAARYSSWLEEINLGCGAELRLPEAVYETAGVQHYHIYNQYVIRTSRRETLRRHLMSCGIGTEVYYPVPLHLQPCLSEFGGKEGDFPEAERAAEETVVLPIYPELTEIQQRVVVQALQDFYSG